MKNLFVLPTDKPSRLYKNLLTDKLFILKNSFMDVSECNREYQNINITSENEDINENDYIITKDGKLVQVSYLLSEDLQGASKVISTTDPKLIKDGVQAIDEEFLEWFVNNPSCKDVEVKEVYFNGSGYYDENQLSEQEKVLYSFMKEYKIITTKEEPSTKLHIGEVVDESYPKEFKQQCKDCNDNLTDCTCIEDTVDMKQETLEQAFVRFMERNYSGGQITKGFVLGAMKFAINWKQEQDKNKFSEVFQWLASRDYLSDKVDIIQKEFEQFKKK